jgi:hypothetical protein
MRGADMEDKGSDMTKCLLCDDTGWVCEAYPDQPWEGPHALRRRWCAVPTLQRPRSPGFSEEDAAGARGCRCR